MTNQFFTDLDDLSSESLVGGKRARNTFYTAKVSWTDTNGDNIQDLGDTYSWDGGWKQHSSSGKGNNGGGLVGDSSAYNNRFSTSYTSGLVGIQYFTSNGVVDLYYDYGV
jgi:hypothetical protein